MTRKYLVFLVLGFASGAAHSAGEFVTPMNGYTNITIDTEFEQKNPLAIVVNETAPKAIQNNGQMLNFLLSKSGFSLQSLDETNPDTLRMYAMPLPETLRSIKFSTLAQAIDVVIGRGFTFEVNYISRQISIVPRSHS